MDQPVDKLLQCIGNGSKCCLHFVDIENLVGSGFITEESVALACHRYVSSTKAKDTDIYFIAAGPQNKDAVVNGWDWGYKFFQFRKGKDGADDALVTFFGGIDNVNAFEAIYVASGDHKLSSIASQASERGVPVTVVSRRGARSRDLLKYPQVVICGVR